jgi:ABC-type sulfate transport system substrate-binding protein
MTQAGGKVEIVVPEATIFSEHPVVIIDRNVDSAKRPVVEAFVHYLWSDEAQQAFVKSHFRSVTNETFNDANPEFARISMPFYIDYFGGWDKAYPDVIEGIFKSKVQMSR